ncbi:MAG: hypothetical protein J3Q66DRAFT_338498 [Benniella sp.]|nr:MAG: hypothetical protein J3Q66DRAFT_338498 [Benniella sp.]
MPPPRAPSGPLFAKRGGCGGISPWSPSTAYTGGQKVTYGGYLYTAKWWTQAEVPGGPSWTRGPAC